MANIIQVVRGLGLQLLKAHVPRRQRESGQGMVEYALILVLIAVVVIVILGVIGHQINNVFSNLNCSLANPCH